ncbi:MAG: biliverdin-producing heme oxygenase [Sphingomonas sp.]|uniref:biliverdin-producing heme oxygenase n=1 Tax=Sphingomonas sp. TaxID=28214 RepID=UPI0022731CA9|nr:biliverdin-producing heme oxygenase [Sphingomonas sp.]MCX8476788.1 biliverdin-producing heme oxygenase [Sphingomonas sp.]
MSTTTMLDAPNAADRSRSKRLKASTQAAHERLDTRIMAGQPFRDRERYGLFLRVQYLFHRAIDPLYLIPALQAVLPDLDGRRRLAAIRQDLADLEQGVPDPDAGSAFKDRIDLPTAFGWLYVAEGSNLGAAFLFKAAAALGLDAGFGARHLAGHPDGRAQHWREFTAALDALELEPEEDARVIAGAEAAFAHVRALVDATFTR